jgi:hypothetical protein
MRHVLITTLLCAVATQEKGCDFQLTPPAAQVVLWPDGSGEVFVFQGEVCDPLTGDAANDGRFTGARDCAQAGMTYRMTCARFDAIDKLAIADITFSLVKREGDNILTVRVPASRVAAWYKRLTPSPQDIERDERMQKLWFMRQEERKASDPPPDVELSIQLPGVVLRQRVAGPGRLAAWKAESRDPKYESGKPEQKHEARLFVPLKDLLAAAGDIAEWEIVYGPTIQRVKEDWEKSRK